MQLSIESLRSTASVQRAILLKFSHSLMRNCSLENFICHLRDLLKCDLPKDRHDSYVQLIKYIEEGAVNSDRGRALDDIRSMFDGLSKDDSSPDYGFAVAVIECIDNGEIFPL